MNIIDAAKTIALQAILKDWNQKTGEAGTYIVERAEEELEQLYVIARNIENQAADKGISLEKDDIADDIDRGLAVWKRVWQLHPQQVIWYTVVVVLLTLVSASSIWAVVAMIKAAI